MISDSYGLGVDPARVDDHRPAKLWGSTGIAKLLNRLRPAVTAAPPSIPVRYSITIVVILAVAVLRGVLFEASAPYFLFTPAVIFIALFLGPGAGLCATLLSTFCAAFAVSVAVGTSLPPMQMVASLLYAVTTIGLVGLVLALQEALRLADAAQAKLADSVVATTRREAFLSSVLASSTDCIKVLDLDGRLTFMTEGGQRVMEVSDFNAIAGCPWPDFWAGAGNVSAKAALSSAREGRASSFVDQASTMGGTAKWWHVAVSPISSDGGLPERILSVSRDITPLREAEEELKLMNAELAHRLKNVLAVVQSIAQQTLRNAPDTPTASRNLAARLVALGTATNVLTESSWRSAGLHELAERTLAPHGQLGERIILEGPAIILQQQVAVALALALHELATNAAKYGALATDTGTVTVRWWLDGSGPQAHFHLTWQERGGPPVVPPTQRGFGSTLIERSLRSYFGGTAASDYQPDGLVFTLDAPVDGAVLTIGKA